MRNCKSCQHPAREPDLIDGYCYDCWPTHNQALPRGRVALTRQESPVIAPRLQTGVGMYPLARPLPSLDRTPGGFFERWAVLAGARSHRRITEAETRIILAETQNVEARRAYGEAIRQQVLDLERTEIEHLKLDLERTELTNKVAREALLGGLVMDRQAARLRREIAEQEHEIRILRGGSSRTPATSPKAGQPQSAAKSLPSKPPVSPEEQERRDRKAAIEQIQQLKEARREAIRWATDGQPEDRWGEEVEFEVRRIQEAFNRRLDQAWEEFSALFGGRRER